MIEAALTASIIGPLAVGLLLTLRTLRAESTVARWAFGAANWSAGASAVAVLGWVVGGSHPSVTAPHALFGHDDYRFTFELALDGVAVAFLALVQFATGIVMRFSRVYLHREPGFQRFFATVLFFHAAMCLLTVAGNLDLMFAAWEMVGLSSFLLIAFYRERQSAVRNALKTYSVYRVADIGMLLAACLEGSGRTTAIGLCLVLAALGKSAQVPFSFWVPRAMEGPTPSSALFYGALSVHAGAYLLLRTYPLWHSSLAVHLAIALVGLTTAVVASLFSRVQTTIKGQVGYASVSQVGMIFVEIALGLPRLAMVHTVCNALLRCYQLLVSPSVVAQRLRRQATAGAAQFDRRRSPFDLFLPSRWRPTLYAFSISEGYFREVLKAASWFPLRRLGEALRPRRNVLFAAGVLAVAATLTVARGATGRADLFLSGLLVALAVAFSACGLALWRRPMLATSAICGSSVLSAMALYALVAARHVYAASFYTIGIGLACVSSLLGFAVAVWHQREVVRFSGLVAKRPTAAAFALLGALGVAGFPMLPTFWGEDLLLHSSLGESWTISILLAGLLALNGYLAVRNFAFTFFGPGEAEPEGAQASTMRTPSLSRQLFQRGAGGLGDGDRERDGGAAAHLALDPDSPPVGLDDPLDDRQPEAGAGPARAAGLPEPVERMSDRFRGDAGARVGHPKH
jgi:NADH-quinone oxidoreductase subunit L